MLSDRKSRRLRTSITRREYKIRHETNPFYWENYRSVSTKDRMSRARKYQLQRARRRSAALPRQLSLLHAKRDGFPCAGDLSARQKEQRPLQRPAAGRGPANLIDLVSQSRPK